MSQTKITGGLCLSRKPGESILIGEQTEVCFSEVRGKVTKVYIKAPQHVRVIRKEVLERSVDDVSTTV